MSKRKGTSPGEVRKYVLANMHRECCFEPWPYASRRGYAKWGNEFGDTAYTFVCTMVHGPRPTPKHQAMHACCRGNEGCFSSKCLSWGLPKDNANHPITRARLSAAALKQKPPSAAARAKMSTAGKRRMTPEYIKMLNEARREMSPESRARLSAASKRHMTPEHIAKMHQANREAHARKRLAKLQTAAE
jgi:hypothetical protein